MLFSNDDIAGLIQRRFEPVWQSVRAVPKIQLDFGNGRVVTRTLHGNIATYLCHADGSVVDILPGIYEPQAYLQQLDQFHTLSRWIQQQKRPVAESIAAYHDRQLQALRDGLSLTIQSDPPRGKQGKPNVQDFSKVLRIEGPLELVLQPSNQALRQAIGQAQNAEPPPSQVARLAEETTVSLDPPKSRLWKDLAEDTRINQTVRRKQIHQRLADSGRQTPDQITRWLYREVLHSDLDDPYLGLQETLFANYPFDDH